MSFWRQFKTPSVQSSGHGAYGYGPTVYIGSAHSTRYVNFPAFISDLKYSVEKEQDAASDLDKDGTVYVQKTSTVKLQLTLDVPANNIDEAMNNLAKVVEIMRMVAIPKPKVISRKGKNEEGEEITRKTIVKDSNRIYMLMSNLISRGNINTPSKITGFSQLRKHGLPGYIKDFNYTPDFDAGFFATPTGGYSQRAPKNIKVNIDFNVEAIPADDIDENGDIKKPSFSNAASRYVIRGLSWSGEFATGDSGGFPFGICIRDNRHYGSKDYTYKTLNNEVSNNPTNKANAKKHGSYFMIGNWYSKPKGSAPKSTDTVLNKWFKRHNPRKYRTPAYCSFQAFIEDFKFSKKTALEVQKVEGSDVGVIYNGFSDENSQWSIKFSIIADNLDQAKKNCGKIQVLMRLFFSDNKIIIKNGTPTWNMHTATRRRVFAPHFIESPSANWPVSLSNVPSVLKQNGVGCEILKLDVNVNKDLGYFSSAGHWYPKAFTVSIDGAITGMRNTKGGLPKNYNSKGQLEYKDDNKNIPFKFKG